MVKFNKKIGYTLRFHTPHLAWATRESRTRLMATAVANLAAFLQGNPINMIN